MFGRNKFMLPLILCLMLFLATDSCKELNEAVEQIYRISLWPECAVHNIGQTQNYMVRELDQKEMEVRTIPNSEVQWSVADATIAEAVSEGQLSTAMGGNTEITATYMGKTAKALLSVNPISSHHNCRSIEWYRSQMNTGAASNNNCGPTATHMAIKWHKNSYINIPTVDTIRSRHPRNNGWWYTSDIQESLDHYNIPYAIHSIEKEDDLKRCLERGNIILLCMEMKWITYARHPFYDRFYNFDSGHFLIVKGYSDDGQYFIVYDPNSWGGDYYEDGTMMGRNRYYRRKELLHAVKEWWPYAFEVGADRTLSTFDPVRLPLGNAGPKTYLMQYEPSPSPVKE